MNRKIQNSIISGAIALMAGFSSTSFLFNSFDWMKNHRAISTVSAGVGILAFAGSKHALDQREVPQLVIKEAVVNELTFKLADPTLTEKEVAGLQESIAIFQCEVDRLREQSRVHVTTLNQLL